MAVTVSIVSYNTKKLLKRCLNNLLSSGEKAEFIWVVDNNSSDGSARMIDKEFPRVNLIKNDQNLGFAKAHNLVLKKFKTDKALLLNPDTIFSKNAISDMEKFMDQNPACGIASCKLIGLNSKLHSNGGDFPIGSSLINWLFNLESLGLRRNFHRRDEKYYQEAAEVDWVGGTFMMIKREVFEKIGFLPEDYFMYIEDTDFCFKAKRAGFKVMINPKVVTFHISGASSENPHLAQWKGEFRGLLKFYNKYFGKISTLFLKLLIYKAILLRIMAFFLLGRLNSAKTYVEVLKSI